VPSQTFWVLGTICEAIVPGYYTPSLPGLRADMRTLQELLQALHPPIVAHLQALDVPLDLVCSQWLLALFSMNLPRETLFLLWDALFLRGRAVLLAAVLATLSLAWALGPLAACSSFEEVVLLVRSASFFDALAMDSTTFMAAVNREVEAMESVNVATIRSR
jgi:hypothetical protein